jgi:hypothetical protein
LAVESGGVGAGVFDVAGSGTEVFCGGKVSACNNSFWLSAMAADFPALFWPLPHAKLTLMTKMNIAKLIRKKRCAV